MKASEHTNRMPVSEPAPTASPVRKPTREEAAEALAIIRGFLQWLPTQPHPDTKDTASSGDPDPPADKEHSQ